MIGPTISRTAYLRAEAKKLYMRRSANKHAINRGSMVTDYRTGPIGYVNISAIVLGYPGSGLRRMENDINWCDWLKHDGRWYLM